MLVLCLPLVCSWFLSGAEHLAAETVVGPLCHGHNGLTRLRVWKLLQCKTWLQSLSYWWF